MTAGLADIAYVVAVDRATHRADFPSEASLPM